MLCFFLLIIIALLKIIPFYNSQLFYIFALEMVKKIENGKTI